MTEAVERDYVLGTDDDEIARLGLQHRVWRPRVLDAWRRAGFTLGQTLLDIGCGPGHASIDLAEIVGSDGRIVAIDRSRRFLEALGSACRRRGIDNVEGVELDLDKEEMPSFQANGAWCRWVFCFLSRPQEILAKVASALRPGGVLVLHEYFDYSTWRFAPPSSEIEEFVNAVMTSWRAEGGEPDIGLELPRWLGELGFETKSLRPIVDIVPSSDFVWHWPKTFAAMHLQRLVDLGHLTKERSSVIARALANHEAQPDTHVVTPAVLEIIAVNHRTRRS